MSSCLKFDLHMKISMAQDFVLGLGLLQKLCSALARAIRTQCDLEPLLLKQS